MFTVQAKGKTQFTIVNYDHNMFIIQATCQPLITIVNYDRNMFIVQARGVYFLTVYLYETVNLGINHFQELSSAKMPFWRRAIGSKRHLPQRRFSYSLNTLFFVINENEE